MHKFGRAWDRMSLKINVDKNKVLVVWRDQTANIDKVKGSGDEL